ncbi:Aminopeptidase S [Aquisphaera giovannonii]|uniref:Carboxypeptidase Q n=1 Tax=Aquisphaera giovannonii TaxID=406548 RepID=A0A5B9W798_9BACT|nr:M20/M25/M40 family metallo-hydrolase [Aquisphaera giovannonii]QEH35965.1 Aminopeptidase S [Aquisphaera giovannonii]
MTLHRKKSLWLALASTLAPAYGLLAQEPPRPQPAPGPKPAARPAVASEKKDDEGKDAEKKAAEPEKKAAEVSTDPIERIKDEGLNRSQVMATLSYLTDVIGPRLTASPGLKRANEWTCQTLAKWGMSNAHLEAWGPFGKGWTLKRFSAQVIEPQCIPLIAFPKAWSPGTDGPLKAPVVYFNAKSEAEFAKFKGKIKGAIVLTGAPREISSGFEPEASRRTDSQLLELANSDGQRPSRAGAPGGPNANRGPGGPNAPGGPRRGDQAAGPGGPGGPQARPSSRFGPEMIAQMQLAAKKGKFLADEGAAVLVDCSSQGDGGTLFVAQASIPGVSSFALPGQPRPAKRASVWDKDAPRIPVQLTMAKEHYNRLVRMIEQGESPTMVVDLSVQFHDEDLMAYNTIAEIPGTDKKDEVVMLGAHIDSWHSATGTTDNGAGCAATMEAMRILKALDLKPRRTIRIGLWSGEEQGLFGSRAYVAQHFGKNYDAMAAMMGTPQPSESAEKDEEKAKSPAGSSDPKGEFDRFSAYYNLDNGTGKIRGVYMEGNEAVRPIFRKFLAPFREMGATTLTLSNTGGTDHQSFDGIGLPGFQFIQDEIHYSTRTHHSNQDVYDQASADDLKQAAVILAAFAYETANLDEKLPRKPARPAPARRTPTASAAGAPGGPAAP